MASIPIHNETEYTLTDDMTKQIIRDAQEHFGEDVRSIRVQYGIERHAFNARTSEPSSSMSPSMRVIRSRRWSMRSKVPRLLLRTSPKTA